MTNDGVYFYSTEINNTAIFGMLLLIDADMELVQWSNDKGRKVQEKSERRKIKSDISPCLDDSLQFFIRCNCAIYFLATNT